MSDNGTYPVSGDLDFRTEQSFADVFKYDDTIAAVFGSPAKVNVRRAKDVSKGSRTMPAISVECIVEQTLPRTNEYRGRVQIHCETQADDDPDGQQSQALAGAVRDCLHKDSTPQYNGHFEGDCNGFLEAVNKTGRDIVFHQIHEGETTEEDVGRTRKFVLAVDCWMYPGRPE